MIKQPLNRRRQLLPWWMRVFIWISMLLGASSIAVQVLNILGIYTWLNSSTEATLYGMETYENYSLLALVITALLIFKGITAFGMWMETDWAIRFGIIDATIGIVICLTMMLLLPFLENHGGHFEVNFRFELLLLIPYLIKCLTIRKRWTELPEALALQRIAIMNEPKTERATIETIAPEKTVEEKTKPEEKIDKEEKTDKEDPTRFMPK